MEVSKSLLPEHQNRGEMLYSEIEEEADCQPHAEKEETMGSAKTEKKINIVRKGLDWKSRNHVEINIKEIAHPVDKALVGVLETAHVNELLKGPLNQLVSLQFGPTLATGIVLDDKNFPELYGLLKASADALGIHVPYTVISNEFEGINAFATGTDENPFIVISNYAPKLLSGGELQFIIAHECGHIAMEHMVYHTAGSLAQIMGGYLPVIGPALSNIAVFPLNCWNRCSEVTADRIGLIACGSLQTAQMALLKIVGGFTDVEEVDIRHYIMQGRRIQNRQVLGKLNEYFQSHPMIYKRLEALEYFADSELYYRAAKKPFPEDRKLIATEELNEKVSDLLRII